MSAPVIAIAAYTPAQWPAYREVRLRALADAPDAFVSRYEVAQAREDGWWQALLTPDAVRTPQVIYARAAGKPVGMVCGTIEASRPDVCHVTQMWTAPEARGHGVGRALLDAVIDWARRGGVTFVELGVVVDNGPAQRLYAGYGFVAFGDTYPLRPGSPLRSQSMRLSLV